MAITTMDSEEKFFYERWKAMALIDLTRERLWCEQCGDFVTVYKDKMPDGVTVPEGVVSCKQRHAVLTMQTDTDKLNKSRRLINELKELTGAKSIEINY